MNFLVEVVVILIGLAIWVFAWTFFGYLLRHFDVLQDENKEEK